MKKFFAGIGMVLIGATVYAVFSSTSNVSNIEDKSAQSSATESEKRVTADEFNMVVETMKGINVDENSGKYNLGLEINPITGVDLTVGGILKIDKESTSVNCAEKGVIFYNTDNHHFWSCGTERGAPVRLDVRECDNIVNGVCDNATENTCTAGVLNDIADDANNYLWECKGIDGGTTDSCSKLKPVDGVCDNSVQNGCSAGTGNDAAVADTVDYYKWACEGLNGGITNLSCQKAKPVCTGGSPAHASLCTDDDTGLDRDTAKTLVASCTDAVKCEYVCGAGYTYDSHSNQCEVDGS